MKQKKIKTYVLILSERFPQTHERKSQQTFFFKNFQKTKIHTLRKNFDLWFHRIQKVNDGEAQIEIRKWSGKPYRSTQEHFYTFEAGDKSIGVQKLEFNRGGMTVTIDGAHSYPTFDIAENDGLDYYDFHEFFNPKSKKGFPTDPMAVIHFTNFRYLPF